MSGVFVTAKLAKIAQINPPLGVKLAPSDPVSFVPMASVSAETARVESTTERPYAEVSKGYTAFLSGDVLVAKITPCFENGKIAQAVLPHPHGFGSTEFHVIRPIAGVSDGRYLHHILRLEQLRTEGQRRMTGSGGQRRVPANFLAEVDVPLPPLPKQRRIAAILDQADTLRTQRRAALAQLDSLTQSLFIDMFGDDAHGEPTFPTMALVNVLETPLQNGAYYPKEQYTVQGGIEMVHMSDAFNGVVSRGGLKRVNCSEADLKKYSLTESDILLARRSLTYEGAAKPCLIPAATEPLLFESSFIRVTPDKAKLAVPYLFHYLNNERIREKRVRPYVTQSTISGINQSNLERVSVVVPPLPLQQTFATRVQAIEALKAQHRAALAEADALFAALQQRAFAGGL